MDLKDQFFAKPTHDPRTGRRVYRNKTPYNKLVEEFGDPYESTDADILKRRFKNTPGRHPSTGKKINKQQQQKLMNQYSELDPVFDIIFKQLYDTLSLQNIFSFYLLNKKFSRLVDDVYLNKYNKPFLVWVNDYLEAQYQERKRQEHEELLKQYVREKQEILRQEELRQERFNQERLRQEELKREQERLRQERLNEWLRQEELKREQERIRQEEIRQEQLRKIRELNIFAELNINNKKDWYNWLRVNHPDKSGGNTYLTQLVIAEGRRRGY